MPDPDLAALAESWLIAVVGSKLVDTTNGKAYICSAYVAGTNNITWTVVGAQT